VKPLTPVNRVEFLQGLEAVEPGISPRAIVAQDDCYCFRAGRVHTFDSEVYCRRKTNLPEDLTGAVHAKPLLDAVRQLKTEDLMVGTDGGEFVVKAKRDEVRVRMDPDIQLPLDAVEKPGPFRPLPPEFPEALARVCECAGKDDATFLITCVHFHPNWIECFDNIVFARQRMKTGVKDGVLVRAKACKAIAGRGPTKISQGREWLHFLAPGGLRISVCQYDPAAYNGEQLPFLSAFTERRGEPVPFPKSLVEASKLADLFARENSDDPEVSVTLKEGEVVLEAVGVSGRARHRGKVKYRGRPLSFRVGPLTLSGMIEKNREIQVDYDLLIVDGGRWFFSASTKPVTEKNGVPKKVKKKEVAGDE
jgi:hypothetical protein